MLSVEQARAKLIAAVNTTPEIDSQRLERAHKKILATDLFANINVPPTDNSAMDGYAVFAHPTLAVGTTLPISQTIAAGQAAQPLAPNSCARIFTGAEVPSGANAVVIQEDVTREGNSVTLNAAVASNDNVRPAGQDIQQGSQIGCIGDSLSAALLGIIASTGIAEVPVFRTLKVALLNTGQELIQPGHELQPGQIYNSNRYTLNALLEQLGCDVVCVQTLPDNLEKTQATLDNCARLCDLIITSGGVSVGDEDHIKTAIDALGSVELWRICVKPGKPLAFGHIRNGNRKTPILGLPGNPVSAYVTFLLFAVPLIQKLQGRQSKNDLTPWCVSANFNIDKKRSRPEYVRVKRTQAGLELFNSQSSGVLSSIHWADGLGLIPAQTFIKRGDAIDFFPFNDLLNN